MTAGARARRTTPPLPQWTRSATRLRTHGDYLSLREDASMRAGEGGLTESRDMSGRRSGELRRTGTAGGVSGAAAEGGRATNRHWMRVGGLGLEGAAAGGLGRRRMPRWKIRAAVGHVRPARSLGAVSRSGLGAEERAGGCRGWWRHRGVLVVLAILCSVQVLPAQALCTQRRAQPVLFRPATALLRSI